MYIYIHIYIYIHNKFHGTSKPMDFVGVSKYTTMKHDEHILPHGRSGKHMSVKGLDWLEKRFLP